MATHTVEYTFVPNREENIESSGHLSWRKRLPKYKILCIFIISVIIIASIVIVNTKSGKKTFSLNEDNKSNIKETSTVAIDLPSTTETKYFSKKININKTLTSNNNYTVCKSKECMQTSKSFLSSMNLNIDPCDDFYRFSCDNWLKNHQNTNKWIQMSSVYGIVREKIIQDSINYLEDFKNHEKLNSLKKAKNMFHACVDQTTRDKLGYSPVFKLLKKLNLPEIPNNLQLNKGTAAYYLHQLYSNFSWIDPEVALHRNLNLQLLIGFSVIPNITDASRNFILLSKPTLKSDILNLVESTNEKRIDMKRLIRTLLNTKSLNSDISPAEEAKAKALFTFNFEIIKTLMNYKFGYVSRLQELQIKTTLISGFKFHLKILELYEDESLPKTKIARMTIESFLSFIDKYSITDNYASKWQKFLKKIFEGTNVNFNPNEFVQYSLEDGWYFINLEEALLKFTTGEIEFWYWWRTVTNLVIETTTDVDNFLKGLDTTDIIKKNVPKTVDCAVTVNKNMDFAMSHALISQYPNISNKISDVNKMLENLKIAFKNHINAASWMDAETKRKSVEKLERMKSYIGYPDWISNETKIENMYSNLVVNDNTHLENIINAINQKKLKELNSLHKINTKDWKLSPLTVNAQNYILDNSITIPMTMFFHPLYNLGSDVLNYGSLGAIIGHELSHAFDNIGRQFDENGKISNWWSNSSVEHYEDEAKCFIEQYDKYYIPQIKKFVNGTISLGENIADSGGLHHAFSAYQINNQNNEDIRLPGLEEYSSDQLFFISYANLWCAEEKNYELKIEQKDEHCPYNIRVIGTLVNTQEFADTFECEEGSRMNPLKKKCKIF